MNCAPAVRGILEDIDGVAAATVSFEEKTASVNMESGKALTQGDCDKAFRDSAYSVLHVKETSEQDH